jgi:hypothetical protein
MPDALPPCKIPTDLVRFKYPLPHLAAALKGQGAVKIVAIGSSSTAGREDVLAYPCRLELNLRKQFHIPTDPIISVLNKGRGGEEAPTQLERFDRDVVDEAPALVIWQVGTNAIFHGKPAPAEVAEAIAKGLQRLSGLATDVALMDLQYAPAMLLDDRAEAAAQMVSLIAAAADQAKVNLFRRFALMRHWNVYDNVGLEQMIDLSDPARLHQNDWATDCLAKALFGAILDAVAMKQAA